MTPLQTMEPFLPAQKAAGATL